MGCFVTPEYFLVTPPRKKSTQANEEEYGRLEDTYTFYLAEAQAFCDRIGYPVMVKGVQGGHALCNGWGSVSSVIASYPKDNSRKHHCFIQKGIVGAEKTIIFAAVEGELTGCLLLTKQLNTSDGKVWGGELAVVPPIVVEALREYLNDTKWTGGGELEFIETHTDRLRVDPGTLPTWYLIDFNTRFPAWVNAVMQCADGGCNLPMDLVAHMTLKRKFGEGYVWQGFTAYENFEPTLFTRTVSEIAVTKVNAGLHFSQISSAGSGAITKGSNIADRDTSVPEPASLFKPPEIIPMVRLREKSITEIMDDDDCDASSVKLHITSDLANVCKTATSLIERVGDDLLTPQYVLSLDTIKKSLKNHCSFINAAVTKAVSDSSNPLRLQMYLSVKTQPHVDVLVAAKDMGYFAECISMGEVRAALAAGFSAEQIILTGPGKFWDTISAAESKKIGLGREGAKLAGLFADSVEDLRTLLRRLSDPEDWLDCNMLGVRFKNVGGARSRFGVDGSNPYILQTIGELCRRHMPPDMKLGVHFHFAASAPSTGLPKWYGMAGANADLASKFATLCGRDVIDSVDFGGGWNSHVVDGGVDGIRNLASMISRISNPSALHTTCIQFELGKCISERAGGMICTILEIRELDIGAPQYTLRTDANTIADGFDLEYQVEESDDSGGEDEEVLKLKVKRRAIVVDSCIGEISSPHMHPLFWRNTHDKEAKGHCDWRPIGHGKDEVWGRTCMEFDVLSGFAGGWGGHGGTCGATYGCKVTSDMRPGDQILIACCGAYDMRYNLDTV